MTSSDINNNNKTTHHKTLHPRTIVTPFPFSTDSSVRQQSANHSASTTSGFGKFHFDSASSLSLRLIFLFSQTRLTTVDGHSFCSRHKSQMDDRRPSSLHVSTTGSHASVTDCPTFIRNQRS
jgi:hypothetical protein